MKINEKNWHAIFEESEEHYLNSLATYLCFLSTYLHFLSTTENEKEQFEIETNIMISLSLIEKIHMYLLNRNTLLAEKKECSNWTFFVEGHEMMEQSIKDFRRILNTVSFKNQKSKRQCQRILKQITHYYVFYSSVMKKKDPQPSPPWISKKKNVVYVKY